MSHIATGLLGALFGASLREEAEPAFTAIGGAAAVGSALGCALAAAQAEPQWDKAMGRGAALGAVAGAGLLALEMAGIG